MSDKANRKRGRPSDFDPVYVRDIAVQYLSLFLIARPDVLLANLKRPGGATYMDKLRDKAVFSESIVRLWLKADADTDRTKKNWQKARVLLFTYRRHDYEPAKVAEWANKSDHKDVWIKTIANMEKAANSKDTETTVARLIQAKWNVDEGNPAVIPVPSLASTIEHIEDFI